MESAAEFYQKNSVKPTIITVKKKIAARVEGGGLGHGAVWDRAVFRP
jgi:hypothetical protein